MLPEWYKKWIPRVSELVSFVFPFSWDSKKRYLKWIYQSIWNKIEYKWEYDIIKAQELRVEFPELATEFNLWQIIECEEIYLREAQKIWTFVHEQMEFYMLDKTKQSTLDPLYIRFTDTIKYWLNYIDELDNKLPWIKWLPEQIVRDNKNRFQWTIDLIRVNEETKTVWLYDYKTWWIAKEIFWLPNNYNKPYDKLKKVSAQLSFYAERYRQMWYTIWWIYRVYLHNTWLYEYKLDIYSTEEIEKILEYYSKKNEIKISNIDIIIKQNPMQIEVNTAIPWQPYSNARVILEETDIKEFKNIDKAIEQAVSLQKKLLNEYWQ